MWAVTGARAEGTGTHGAGFVHRADLRRGRGAGAGERRGRAGKGASSRGPGVAG